jgi:hypothetical protein
MKIQPLHFDMNHVVLGPDARKIQIPPAQLQKAKTCIMLDLFDDND